ncbi:chemotaxis protein CheW [Shewanella maritima]|uniref:chemotaxis protein CheW n=1 Tax=Shewanella maritima TaxID=2520507 RepID=UPI003736D291
MSKSVDETVFDYFAMLLQEPATDATAELKENKQPDPAPLAAEKSNKVYTKKSSATTNQTQPLDEVAAALINKTVETRQPNQTNRDPLKVSTPDEYPKAQPQVARATPNASFAQPTVEKPVDKQALEKLLSAVSKPTVGTVETKVKPETLATEQQIKASAAKVRQAILEKPAPKAQQVVQKAEVVDKEINSLADIKLVPSALEPAKEAIINSEQQNVAQTQVGKDGMPPEVVYNLKDVLDDEFQVLFFNVAGLTLAVPLVSLGGIVKRERINNIIGRPKWFMGVQPHRDGQINVVDSCAWVMPEKYTPELAETLDYQYIVMLEDSEWGLTCESLVNAVKIDKSHVNWREKPGKRPWLAGVVKEQMCGILHVKALIEMLEAGLGCQDTIDRG